jgi:hypothetical protein
MEHADLAVHPVMMLLNPRHEANANTRKSMPIDASGSRTESKTSQVGGVS